MEIEKIQIPKEKAKAEWMAYNKLIKKIKRRWKMKITKKDLDKNNFYKEDGIDTTEPIEIAPNLGYVEFKKSVVEDSHKLYVSPTYLAIKCKEKPIETPIKNDYIILIGN